MILTKIKLHLLTLEVGLSLARNADEVHFLLCLLVALKQHTMNGNGVTRPPSDKYVSNSA